MEELFFLVEEDPGGGYTARALGHAIFTQGETIDDVKDNIREAVACDFDRLKPGTLSGILGDVAARVGTTKEDPLRRLFD